jgi:hypothetical protein
MNAPFAVSFLTISYAIAHNGRECAVVIKTVPSFRQQVAR